MVICTRAHARHVVGRRGFLVNACECCGAEVYPWVPLPMTDPILSLPQCLECGMLTCLMCRLDHNLAHDHQACNRARFAGE